MGYYGETNKHILILTISYNYEIDMYLSRKKECIDYPNSSLFIYKDKDTYRIPSEKVICGLC